MLRESQTFRGKSANTQCPYSWTYGSRKGGGVSSSCCSGNFLVTRLGRIAIHEQPWGGKTTTLRLKCSDEDEFYGADVRIVERIAFISKHSILFRSNESSLMGRRSRSGKQNVHVYPWISQKVPEGSMTVNFLPAKLVHPLGRPKPSGNSWTWARVLLKGRVFSLFHFGCKKFW